MHFPGKEFSKQQCRNNRKPDTALCSLVSTEGRMAAAMAAHAHCVPHKWIPTAVSARLHRQWSAAHARKVSQHLLQDTGLLCILLSCPLFGQLLGVGRDRANQKSHVFMGIWTYNGCCKPECEVSICDLLDETSRFFILFLNTTRVIHHCLWTPDWDGPLGSSSPSLLLHYLDLSTRWGFRAVHT